MTRAALFLVVAVLLAGMGNARASSIRLPANSEIGAPCRAPCSHPPDGIGMGLFPDAELHSELFEPFTLVFVAPRHADPTPFHASFMALLAAGEIALGPASAAQPGKLAAGSPDLVGHPHRAERLAASQLPFPESLANWVIFGAAGASSELGTYIFALSAEVGGFGLQQVRFDFSDAFGVAYGQSSGQVFRAPFAQPSVALPNIDLMFPTNAARCPAGGTCVPNIDNRQPGQSRPLEPLLDKHFNPQIDDSYTPRNSQK